MTARERMVRVVAEADCKFRHPYLELERHPEDDDPRHHVAACYECLRAAEAVVAAMEAASIHEAVEKMRSNMEMARATYSTGPIEPTGDISRARERIGKFGRGGEGEE